MKQVDEDKHPTYYLVQDRIKQASGKPMTVRDIVTMMEEVAKSSYQKGYIDREEVQQLFPKQTITIEKRHCGGKNCPGQDGCWGGDCQYPEIIIP